MMSVTDKVKDVLENCVPQEDSFSKFYVDHKEFACMYQKLLDKGVVSKRQSRLLLVSDRASLPPVVFNRTAINRG